MSIVSTVPLATGGFAAGRATVADGEGAGRGSTLAGTCAVLGALGVIEGIAGAEPGEAGSRAGALGRGGWGADVWVSLGGCRLGEGDGDGAGAGASIQGGRAGSTDAAPVTGAAHGSVGGAGRFVGGDGTSGVPSFGIVPSPMAAQPFGAGVAWDGTAGADPVLAAAARGSAGLPAAARVAGGGSATGLAASRTGAGRAEVVEAHAAGRDGGGSGTAVDVPVRVVPTAGAFGLEATVDAAGEAGRGTDVEVVPGTSGTLVVAAGDGTVPEVLAGVTGAGAEVVVDPAAGISTRISLPQLQ